MSEKIDFMSLIPEGSPLLSEEWDQKINADRARREAEEEQERRDRLMCHLVEHGLPIKDLQRATSGECDETPALVATRASFERGDTILVLSGPRGIGKTTAAAWWLCQRRERKQYVSTSPPRFVDSGQLSRWPRYNEERMRELTRARALVVDDLGVEFADQKGAFFSLFDEVANSRYAAELPMLITTNLPANEFKARAGERIVDRIREAGRFEALKGQSLRGRHA